MGYGKGKRYAETMGAPGHVFKDQKLDYEAMKYKKGNNKH